MTIDKMIDTLKQMRDEVGGDAEVPVMMPFGENDYIVPSYGVIGEFEDQDGNKFKCVLAGSAGGSEFTKTGIPHYKWKISSEKRV